MLKLDFILRTMNSIDHCLKEKMIKLMKDELGGKILTNLLD